MKRTIHSSSVIIVIAAFFAAGAAAHEGHKPKTGSPAHLEKLKSWFTPGSIVAGPTVVDCTLSGGAKTKCFSITFKPAPTGFKMGPWCPRNIADGPDKSGIWLDKGKVYNADGAFVKNLSTFYNDKRWQLFDPKTGNIFVTDTKQSCAGAARPDVDPKYQNHCVECLVSYMRPDTTVTYMIPLRPVKATGPRKPVGIVGVGIGFNGTRIDGSAPVHAILGAHTLAPFDHCGGHVNLHVGYHLHAITDCLKGVETAKGHAQMVGIALDGYPLYAQEDAGGKKPQDLDACGGHMSADLGYHYHAADAGKNRIIGCHTGQVGCSHLKAGQYCDASKPRRRP